MGVLYAVIGILAAALCFCAVKIIVMKRSLREIRSQFAQRLEEDTNTQIDITSADRDIRELADDINRQLTVLRREYLKNHQGNEDLKNAITNISHDLRTPLTAIYGYLDLIKKTDDRQTAEKYLQIIKERTEMMNRLTQELFSYSVLLNDDCMQSTAEVCINRLLEECLAGFYPDLTRRGIVPKVDITNKNVVRNANEDALQRVFTNIVNNAVKYSGGDLEVSLDERGVVRFSNTARELSQVQVQQLFDRFYTVEVGRNSTGLGLSIARTLVEQMGGKIYAQLNGEKLCITIEL
ncbi:MAG: HAMP domain-containing histidine kinase [Ruminococcus sp.]|nr:HAMP domain-containing histidine kinase [Ruminococcus sp.]